MRKAREVRLDEVVPEVLARVLGDDLVAHLGGKLVESLSEHVEADAGIQQRHFGLHVMRDARRGVQGNGFPDGAHLLLRHVMRAEKLARGIGAIDLEAFVLAGEALGETEIVKGRGDVEQLGIEPDLALAALLGGEQIDPERVVEEQVAGVLAQDARGLPGETRIGNDEGGRRRESGRVGAHGVASFDMRLWVAGAGQTGTIVGSVASTIFPFGRGCWPSSIR